MAPKDTSFPISDGLTRGSTLIESTEVCENESSFCEGFHRSIIYRAVKSVNFIPIYPSLTRKATKWITK